MIIYFDENMPPHLAKGFNIIQEKESLKTGYTIEIKHFKEVQLQGVKDPDWIKIVGSNGVVITRDINISRRKDELELYKEYNLGMFFIRGKSKKAGMSVWELVQLLSKHWDRIAEIATTESRPFSYLVNSRKGVSKLV